MVDVVDEFLVLLLVETVVDLLLNVGDPFEDPPVLLDVVLHPVLVLEGAPEVGLLELVIDVVPDLQPLQLGLVHAGQQPLPHLLFCLVRLETRLGKETPDGRTHVFTLGEILDFLVESLLRAVLPEVLRIHILDLLEEHLVQLALADGVAAALVVRLGDQLQFVLVLVSHFQVVDGGGCASDAAGQLAHQLLGRQQGPFLIREYPEVLLDPQALFLLDEGLQEDDRAPVPVQRGHLVVPVVDGLLVAHQFDQDTHAHAFQELGHHFEGLDGAGDSPALDEVQL